MADLKEVVKIFNVRDGRPSQEGPKTKSRFTKSKLIDNNEMFDLSSVTARWWPVEQDEKGGLVRVR